MSDNDEFENIDEEDISALEDSPEAEEPGVVSGVGEEIETIAPDTPIYRLRLFYSHETFFAVYRDDNLAPGTTVVVPTRYGKDLAQVIGPVRGKTPHISDIAWIERSATPEDMEKARNNQILERDAFVICKEKIASHHLDMKLVLVHYLLEESKILFFFTADNRVDFRELVKDLVSVFKSRIELRQIGVRDEARVVGGLGVCGRGYCCHAVSDKLRPVSIKMAKDQNLSLNSLKISGPCGRLLCCLSYEYCFYNEQQRTLPQEGARVSHENELWKVAEVNVITGRLRLSAEDGRMMTVSALQLEKVDNRWRVKENL
jgi:cell fate regulator YaaT (PSP1 superfamily)